ncbi:MAG TPA: type VI secretion system tip protein VgrG [Kofleriaceae bacterium]
MPAVTPTILSDGNPLDPAVELCSIDIRREVDRIPQAELRVLDGDAARRQFAASDSGFFDPGAQIEIKLRYEGEPDATVFKGVVVRQRVEAGHDGSLLVIGLKDHAVKLVAARRYAVFENKTDDAIVKQVISDAGLTAGKVTATQPQHAEMVQYDATPWDFLLSRADAQGLLTVVDDGAISLLPMAISGSPAHRFEYGIDEILDFEIETDASGQFESVESVGWSAADAKPTDAHKAKSVTASPGDLDGAKLAKALGNGTCTLTHAVPISPDELGAWADATMARSRLSMCRGRLAIPGLAALKLLDVMEIAGVGKRFAGQTLVTGIRHIVDRKGWRTDVQFGLSPERFSRREQIQDAPAAGLLPGVSGLQIGVVAAFEADPDKELRVRVQLPTLDPTKGLVWARLACPDAGSGRGYYFRPDKDDEVVVGFLNDDPRYPVILGSLYGSKNAPAAAAGTPDDKNQNKGVFTRKGTTLGFVDGDKPSVFIETPNKNKLLLDDDGETVVLTDQHGNSITLSKDGIVLKSAKDLKIDAGGNVEIKGAKVDVK